MPSRIVEATEPSVPALLHPKLAQVYRDKVEDLLAAYSSEARRTQAQKIIRGLIEHVVLTPVDGMLRVELRGELASMLELSATADMRTPRKRGLSGRCKSSWLRGQDLNL